MNNFYVYIYWRLDTNEVFYVGKGREDRWKRLNKRSNHFKRILDKCDIACEILVDNLSEEEAHGIEIYLINELVFNYGYSVDIPNNRSKEHGCHLVNSSWGGEGVSGSNPFDRMSEETKASWIEAHKGLQPMLGKHHSSEARRKISEATRGENNPFYGKHHTEEVKTKMMLDNGDRIMAVNIKDGSKLFFNSIREAHRNGFNRSCISQCLNPNGNQTTHKGYKWYRLVGYA